MPSQNPDSTAHRKPLIRKSILRNLTAHFVVLGLAATSFLFATFVSWTHPAKGSTDSPQDGSPVARTQEEATKFDVKTNLKSYDTVWRTIKESHWDQELVGDAWDQAKDKHRPKVENAKSMKEVREAMEALIGELGQSHFGIIPATSYDVVDGDAGGDGDAGLEFRLAGDNTIIVTRVAADSPADVAGIKPGWQLVKVGKRTTESLLKKLDDAGSALTRRETMAGLALSRIASGDAGKVKTFEFIDNDEKEQSLDLKLIQSPGEMSKFGNLPNLRVHYVSKTLKGGVGYFRFNMFFDPVRVMKAYNEAINDPANQNGFIIDVRGNLGGIAAMTMGMARPFTKEKTKLGTMITRGNKLNFAVFPAAEVYPGPVAILIDECSISSAEILSGGLQDIGAAKVFGQRTAGLALPSTVAKLPSGDGFQYAIANYISEAGKSLEKYGVTPDFPIERTRKSFIENEDPTLSAAAQWIQQQSMNSKSN